ncbi:unnamed protein product, partial [Ectocarpus sp. 12 AP-2014]
DFPAAQCQLAIRRCRDRGTTRGFQNKRGKKALYFWRDGTRREGTAEEREKEQTHVQVLRHCAAAAQRRLGLRACSPAPLTHGNPMLGTRERQMCLLTSCFSGAQTSGHVCPLESRVSCARLVPSQKFPNQAMGIARCAGAEERGCTHRRWCCWSGYVVLALLLVALIAR